MVIVRQYVIDRCQPGFSRTSAIRAPSPQRSSESDKLLYLELILGQVRSSRSGTSTLDIRRQRRRMSVQASRWPHLLLQGWAAVLAQWLIGLFSGDRRDNTSIVPGIFRLLWAFHLGQIHVVDYVAVLA